MSSVSTLARSLRSVALLVGRTSRYSTLSVCAFETERTAFLVARLWKNHNSELLQKCLCRHLYATALTCSIGREEFLESVEKNLKDNLGLKEKQMSLLASPGNLTVEGLKSKNLKLKLSSEEVFKLAVAVFEVEQAAGEKVVRAVTLFEYAHSLGDINASYTFAQLLRGGQGRQADPKKAAEIFTDLALKGHPYAQFALGTMYSAGLGVEQNFIRAFTLYKVSAQNKVAESYRAMGDMYSNGQGVEENLEEAFACYKKAAEFGDVQAHLSIARCYNHGKGVQQSFEKAFEHHLEAAKADMVIGMYNVAVQYLAGKGVEQSYDKAVEYFQKASDKGFAPAQVNLGNMYFTGFGVPKNWKKAKELYQMAAKENKNAQLLLQELEDAERKKLGEAKVASESNSCQNN